MSGIKLDSFSNMSQDSSMKNVEHRQEQLSNAGSISSSPTNMAALTQEAVVQQSRIFPPFNATYFPGHILWLAISFGLLYLLVSRVLVPRIGATISERRDLIEQNLNEALNRKNEVDAMVADYEQSLQAAKTQAREVATSAINEARLAVQNRRRTIEKTLKDKLKTQYAQVEAAKREALQDLDEGVLDFSAALIEKILNKKAQTKQLKAALKDIKSRTAHDGF